MARGWTCRPLGSIVAPMIARAHRDAALSARITEIVPLDGVRAGSALIQVGARLLLVQDDAFTLVWVDPSGAGGRPALTRQVLESDGGPLAKALKPDFEAALLGPGGVAYVLGSGSKPTRRRVARLDTAAGRAHVLDADPLYLAVEAALEETPNLEGAVLLFHQRAVRLFHRRAGTEGRAGATIDVTLDGLEGGPARVLGVARWDLGALQRDLGPGEAPREVPLSFTDAAPGPEGRLFYLAAAEDTPNAVDDGPVIGAAVGVIRGGEARWAPLLDVDGAPTERKAEGLALAEDGRSGFVVTDPDDASRPAELCRVVLEGPW